jgi:AcrR family transcriptional regulator
MESTRRIERAMLELVGERGYGEVTIDGVLERSGSNRTQFYAAYEGKEGCFEAAYSGSLDALLERLLAPCREEVPWGRRMRGALEELVAFVEEEPRIARGLFSGARAAGGGAEARRREALAVLAEAIDSVRTEEEYCLAPPPITARFVLGAIEASALQYIARPEGRDLGAEMKDLLHLVVDAYLGPTSARDEAEAFGRPDVEGPP